MKHLTIIQRNKYYNVDKIIQRRQNTSHLLNEEITKSILVSLQGIKLLLYPAISDKRFIFALLKQIHNCVIERCWSNNYTVN